MSHVGLHCDRCDDVVEARPSALACPRCGGPLDVAYVNRETVHRAEDERVPGIWQHWERLPLHEKINIISLGEGGTPCIRLEGVGSWLGLNNLYAKLEYLNPTGSFKDRGTSVMLSVLKELGFSEAVDDSSGNAGASLSAYAARGNMGAIVFVPASASPFKTGQIGFYGAHVRPIEGSREAVTNAAKQYVEEQKACYASHNLSPYFVEGMKSFAYEAAQQVPGPIHHVIAPVGNGSLLLGTMKGFAELLDDGSVSQLPRLHCVQSQACMPIVAAWRGDKWEPTQAQPTVAGGIAVNSPPRGHQVVQALRATQGSAVAIEEERIVHWQRALAREEGLFIEPTSAAAFAGLEALASQGVIGSQDVTVIPVTGFGLKDPIPES